MTAAHAAPRAPLAARVKHLLATSPAGRPLARLRALSGWPHRLRHPELAELYREDGYIDTLLPRFVVPGTACLDIGAHFGAVAYTLAALSRGGWLGIVEASPWKAALLRRRFPSARVFETAVSDTDGTTTFYENTDRPGFSSLSDRASRGATRALTVPVARLDTLLPDGPRVGFVKIDVEGHEDKALAPFLETATGDMIPDRIVIERVGPDDYPACTAAFERLGYEVVGRTRSNSLYQRRAA